MERSASVAIHGRGGWRSRRAGERPEAAVIGTSPIGGCSGGMETHGALQWPVARLNAVGVHTRWRGAHKGAVRQRGETHYE
jgi:hypothetical protein